MAPATFIDAFVGQYEAGEAADTIDSGNAVVGLSEAGDVSDTIDDAFVRHCAVGATSETSDDAIGHADYRWAACGWGGHIHHRYLLRVCWAELGWGVFRYHRYGSGAVQARCRVLHSPQKVCDTTSGLVPILALATEFKAEMQS